MKKKTHVDILVKELSLDHELAAVNQNYKEAKMKGWKRDLLITGIMIGLVALFGVMFYLVSLI